MGDRVRVVALLVTLAVGIWPAAAQDLFPGWTAGPAADATMAVGRRFDCSGALCPPGGLACLYATAPKGEGRIVPTKDLLRPKGMPWKEIEAWIGGKLVLLDPSLSGDPRVSPANWTVTAPAHLALDESHVVKRYTSGMLAVPMALWMKEGAMNVIICKAASGDEVSAERRIRGLVGDLR